ncbi:MAG: transporter [Proteobacteria bacterium]|nr:transporter [Pseudomonadota bacterium]
MTGIAAKRKRLVTVFVSLFLTAGSLLANPTAAAQPGASGNALAGLSIEELLDIAVYSREPLGLHHTHPQGEWMFGYSYMFMSMDGNRDGSSRRSPADVLNAGFAVSPTAMIMKMHMLELMYGLREDLTVMVMLPYLSISMDHINGADTRFKTAASGVSDLSVTALYNIYDKRRRRVHLTAGLMLPTGSIKERGTTPLGPDQKLPYPMQLGSGTFDPVVGITYVATETIWSWGFHLSHTYRLGENSEDYTLGNRKRFDAWLVREWSGQLSSTLRLSGENWGNIDGADPELNPSMVPTADPARRGGKRLDLGIGINFYMPEGVLSGSRVVLELTYPIVESLDGPQLAKEYDLNVGLQWVF